MSAANPADQDGGRRAANPADQEGARTRDGPPLRAPIWYHVQWSTHGTWMPGDARGFRSRDHRIHSSGNYKDPPPPDEHAGLRKHAKRIQRTPDVRFDPPQRQRVLEALLAKLPDTTVHILAVAVSSTHVHLLLRCSPDLLEKEMSRLRRATSHALRDVLPGKVWARGFHPERIADREHQVKAFRYIERHREEGAVVWLRAPRRPEV